VLYREPPYKERWWYL